MIPRLFVPEARHAPTGPLGLNAGHSHYLGQVLRLRPGAPVECFDGLGGRYRATIASLDKRSAVLDELTPATASADPRPAVTLLQAMTTGDKTDWIVEKATEAGVASIVLFTAGRSTARPPAERLSRKLAHWQRIAVAACAQCGRDRLPVIETARDLGAALARSEAPILIASPLAGDGRTLGAWAGEAGAVDAVTLLVGPESGWSDDELATATSVGATAVSLGPRILRTETAGLVGLVTLMARLGDLQ